MIFWTILGEFVYFIGVGFPKGWADRYHVLTLIKRVCFVGVGWGVLYMNFMIVQKIKMLGLVRLPNITSELQFFLQIFFIY